MRSEYGLHFTSSKIEFDTNLKLLIFFFIFSYHLLCILGIPWNCKCINGIPYGNGIENKTEVILQPEKCLMDGSYSCGSCHEGFQITASSVKIQKKIH